MICALSKEASPLVIGSHWPPRKPMISVLARCEWKSITSTACTDIDETNNEEKEANAHSR